MHFASTEAIYIMLGYIRENGIIPKREVNITDITYREHLVFEVAEGYSLEVYYHYVHPEGKLDDEYIDLLLTFPCFKDKKFFFRKLSDELCISIGRVRNVMEHFKEYYIYQDGVFNFFIPYLKCRMKDNGKVLLLE